MGILKGVKILPTGALHKVALTNFAKEWSKKQQRTWPWDTVIKSPDHHIPDVAYT